MFRIKIKDPTSYKPYYWLEKIKGNWCGTFETREEAENFRDKKLRLYPNAKVVEFVDLDSVMYQEHRKIDYPTAEEFLEAYFEERAGNSEKMDNLIARRTETKRNIPKPQ